VEDKHAEVFRSCQRRAEVEENYEQCSDALHICKERSMRFDAPPSFMPLG
jgi:hypothetical protein